jgi:carboxypeptidase C (cathepsin A)
LSPWKINKKVVGYLKKAGSLQLRNINNAGHLVPMDQGEVALALVNDFVKGTLAQYPHPQQQEQIRVDTA